LALEAITVLTAGNIITVKRSIADTVIASKDSTAITERYIVIATGNGTEAAIINIETGLDRGLFRYERFVEKSISPYY
jgi:hypothetical protein